MIDKKEILNSFSDEDKLLAINLYEKYLLSLEKDIPVFSKDFYPPNIWSFFESKLGKDGFKVETDGLFYDSERREISFNDKYNEGFEICCLKITNKSKFKKLGHRDYLGTILSLGIKRSKLGDLIVKGDECYVAISLEIKQFLFQNLDTISNCPCKLTLIDNENLFPKADFKESVILVSKLRIDAIISRIANISREKSCEYIDRGLVLIDYCIIRDKSKEVKTNQRITIRKVGKFILGDIVGNSKSGKIKVIIKKYT